MFGWVKIHRQIVQWEWFKQDHTVRLFLFILVQAAYEEKRWKGIVVRRGQLVTSLPSLAESLGISIQSVRTSIRRLKSTGEITDISTGSYRIITIEKYEEFQMNKEDPTDDPTGIPTGRQQTSNRPLTASKEVKKVKKGITEESILSDFDSFWELYGHKVGKEKAKKAYLKIRKEGTTHEEVIDGVRRYHDHCRQNGTESRFIKHPASYLNGKHWQDEYTTTKKPLSKHERARIALGLDQEQPGAFEEIDVTPAGLF